MKTYDYLGCVDVSIIKVFDSFLSIGFALVANKRKLTKLAVLGVLKLGIGDDSHFGKVFF